ncbi:MAG TPA: Rrf2 family transcriptional regulator [Xanthobacteraceae bacterium]|nr:Rrf2 family transcriptional regulator [Xanthobacteraceae bacterium]
MTYHTDYAIRMLIYVALKPDGLSTVNEIAQSYGLSRNHLLKVALTLRKLGLIESMRGRSGGIRLAKSAEQINVGTIVRATEEDFSLVECMQATGGLCVISPVCRLKGMFAEALQSYLAVLDGYTLADVIHNRGALQPYLGLEN